MRPTSWHVSRKPVSDGRMALSRTVCVMSVSAQNVSGLAVSEVRRLSLGSGRKRIVHESTLGARAGTLREIRTSYRVSSLLCFSQVTTTMLSAWV